MLGVCRARNILKTTRERINLVSMTHPDAKFVV